MRGDLGSTVSLPGRRGSRRRCRCRACSAGWLFAVAVAPLVARPGTAGGARACIAPVTGSPRGGGAACTGLIGGSPSVGARLTGLGGARRDGGAGLAARVRAHAQLIG